MLAASALAAAAGVSWALLEAHAFTVRHAVVPVLPPGSPSLRLLHISDIHLLPDQIDKMNFIEGLASLKPDLVVNTGDNLAHVDSVGMLIHTMLPLLKLPGAFVLGSNDYFAPTPKSWTRYLRRDPRDADRTSVDDRLSRPDQLLPTREMVAEFTAAGWKDLTNRRDALIVGETHLDLVGVDDPHLDRDEFPARTPIPRGSIRVGVTHAPYLRVLERMREDGAALVLAGHTHGGQLAVPGYGALVTNCDLDRKRAKGLHGWPGARPDEPGGEDSFWLHVSAGLGTSPFAPVRFACRPEATLLELVRRD